MNCELERIREKKSSFSVEYYKSLYLLFNCILLKKKSFWSLFCLCSIWQSWTENNHFLFYWFNFLFYFLPSLLFFEFSKHLNFIIKSLVLTMCIKCTLTITVLTFYTPHHWSFCYVLLWSILFRRNVCDIYYAFQKVIISLLWIMSQLTKVEWYKTLSRTSLSSLIFNTVLFIMHFRV